MIRAFFVYIFSMVILQVSSAATEFDLRKLSLHLRGKPLSMAEKENFASLASAEQRWEFYKSKREEFLNSKDFAKKVSFHLTEKFRLKVRNSNFNLAPSISGNSQDPRLGEMDALLYLFEEVAINNLPWDHLLLASSYSLNRLESVRASANVSDTDFFAPLIPQGKQSVTGDDRVEKWSFPPDSPLVAGALTTSRFLMRYPNTSVNKNRKRAAAVFEIFLCDSMNAVVPPPKDRKNGFLKSLRQLESSGSMSEAQIVEMHKGLREADIHGSDPRCAACHDKLDPMGVVFQPLGMRSSPVAAKGRLFYRRADGTRVNQEVVGPRGLAQAISQQREYVDCQIKWFWRTLIGNDVPLYPDRLDELAHQFEQVGRRTQDFTRIIISQPEFFQKLQGPVVVNREMVKPLLKRCDSCHVSEPLIPQLTKDKLSRSDLLNIQERLSRAPHERGKMPLNWIQWDQKELQLLEQWLAEELK